MIEGSKHAANQKREATRGLSSGTDSAAAATGSAPSNCIAALPTTTSKAAARTGAKWLASLFFLALLFDYLGQRLQFGRVALAQRLNEV